MSPFDKHLENHKLSKAIADDSMSDEDRINICKKFLEDRKFYVTHTPPFVSNQDLKPKAEYSEFGSNHQPMIHTSFGSIEDVVLTREYAINCFDKSVSFYDMFLSDLKYDLLKYLIDNNLINIKTDRSHFSDGGDLLRCIARMKVIKGNTDDSTARSYPG